MVVFKMWTNVCQDRVFMEAVTTLRVLTDVTVKPAGLVSIATQVSYILENQRIYVNAVLSLITFLHLISTCSDQSNKTYDS